LRLREVIQCPTCEETSTELREQTGTLLAETRSQSQSCDGSRREIQKQVEDYSGIVAGKEEDFYILMNEYLYRERTRASRDNLTQSTTASLDKLNGMLTANRPPEPLGPCTNTETEANLGDYRPNRLRSALLECSIACASQVQVNHLICLTNCVQLLQVSMKCSVCLSSYSECLGSRCASQCVTSRQSESCISCVNDSLDCSRLFDTCHVGRVSVKSD
jgi:hypothetical protein